MSSSSTSFSSSSCSSSSCINFYIFLLSFLLFLLLLPAKTHWIQKHGVAMGQVFDGSFAKVFLGE